jgi:tetratricopeptide (TPR) repeat protein
MLTRRLKSHTIIPADLYLRRRADDQLRDIILDMGRPGYVLVARQMGKTNLLLNAKRELPAADDLFVYLDVSNVFPDIRGFFRNIVDVALEGMGTSSVFIADAIQQERATTELPPHKEHERELRRVLQAIKGKVVICLDEIDALTKTAYSDQVFSFIRSVYFSGRANINEFGRLTYVLSGVAEPGELIRNKAISPFNIGEKIYLDDFTRTEFSKFLKMADLMYSEDVAERIFHWTEGNPRMTWDVCASLERHAAGTVSPETVDSVVQELYFGSVDVPPVDHIKAITEQNGEIRDAVMAIHYGKTGTLTDSARTKLYLAGISRFDPRQRVVAFKNKILEKALSEDFIRSVGVRDTAPIDAGIKLFEVGQYNDALALFSLLSRSQPDGPQRAIAFHWAGLSNFRLAKFEEAIASFRGATGVDTSLRVQQWHYEGLSHLFLSRYVEAARCLRRVVGEEKRDVVYFEAKANLSTALLLASPRQTPPSDTQIEGVRLSEQLLEDEKEIRSTVGEAAGSILTAAHLNLARTARNAQQLDIALQHVEDAQRIAGPAERLGILLFQMSLVPSGPRRDDTLSSAVEVTRQIKSFGLNVGSGQKRAVDDVLSLLERLHSAGRKADVLSVLDHVFDHLAPDLDVMDVVNDVLISLLNKGSQQLASVLVQRLLERDQITRIPEAHRSILGIVMLLDESAADNYAEPFLRTFQEVTAVPAASELRFLTAIVTAALGHQNQDLAARAAQIAQRVSPNEETGEWDSSAEILKEYLATIVALKQTVSPGSTAQAASLLRKLTTVKAFNLPYFTKNFHVSMQSELLRAIRSSGAVKPLRLEKKYGRNELVVVDYNGTQKTGKYKKFAEDITAGRCQIVRESDPLRMR